MIGIGLKRIGGVTKLFINENIFWQQPDDVSQRQWVEQHLEDGCHQYILIDDEIVDSWYAGESITCNEE